MCCDLSRLLAQKITKRIHSSKPASLNHPIHGHPCFLLPKNRKEKMSPDFLSHAFFLHSQTHLRTIIFLNVRGKKRRGNIPPIQLVHCYTQNQNLNARPPKYCRITVQSVYIHTYIHTYIQMSINTAQRTHRAAIICTIYMLATFQAEGLKSGFLTVLKHKIQVSEI